MFKVSLIIIIILFYRKLELVFEKDPNLNNSFLIEPPYDFTLLNTKSQKTAIG